MGNILFSLRNYHKSRGILVPACYNKTMLIKGNLGAGKTTYLIKKYGELISKGVKSSEILVICQNAFLRDKFIEKLKVCGLSGGSFPVYTFSGLAYRSILNNWPHKSNPYILVCYISQPYLQKLNSA